MGAHSRAVLRTSLVLKVSLACASGATGSLSVPGGHPQLLVLLLGEFQPHAPTSVGNRMLDSLPVFKVQDVASTLGQFQQLR